MVSHEAILKLLQEANKEAVIPPRPDPKDTKAWIEYFTARVLIAQKKRQAVELYQ